MKFLTYSTGVLVLSCLILSCLSFFTALHSIAFNCIVLFCMHYIVLTVLYCFAMHYIVLTVLYCFAMHYIVLIVLCLDFHSQLQGHDKSIKLVIVYFVKNIK